MATAYAPLANPEARRGVVVGSAKRRHTTVCAAQSDTLCGWADATQGYARSRRLDLRTRSIYASSRDRTQSYAILPAAATTATARSGCYSSSSLLATTAAAPLRDPTRSHAIPHAIRDPTRSRDPTQSPRDPGVPRRE
eukprot:gene10843-biopygen4681